MELKIQHTIQAKIIEVVDNYTPRGWLVIDRSFNIVYANKTYCRWFHLPQAEIIGMSLLDLYGGKKQRPDGSYNGPLVETMDTGKEFREYEVRLPASLNAEYYWFLTNTYLVHDNEGSAEYAVGTYVIIDRFKAIERKLDNLNLSVIMAFSRAIGARDEYTMQHVENVASMLVGLAEYMDLSAEEVSQAYLASIVHDVGKIGIREEVLNKPGKLTDEEFNVMKQHPSVGAEILSGIEGFENICRIVRHHHERFDGRGYPDGLSGEDIPMFSRMIALCDSFDAMTSLRCYRDPVSLEEALVEIERCSGSQFDPALSKIFCEYVRRAVLHAN